MQRDGTEPYSAEKRVVPAMEALREPVDELEMIAR